MAAQYHLRFGIAPQNLMKRRFKVMRFEKPEMKLPLFAMTCYKENPKKSTSKLLKAMSEFVKETIINSHLTTYTKISYGEKWERNTIKLLRDNEGDLFMTLELAKVS